MAWKLEANQRIAKTRYDFSIKRKFDTAKEAFDFVMTDLDKLDTSNASWQFVIERDDYIGKEF